MPLELEISNLKKNCNEALILAILSKGKKHGYQIALIPVIFSLPFFTCASIVWFIIRYRFKKLLLRSR